MISASQAATQIFYVPPHKLLQFLEEACSIFGDSRFKKSFNLYINLFSPTKLK